MFRLYLKDVGTVDDLHNQEIWHWATWYEYPLNVSLKVHADRSYRREGENTRLKREERTREDIARQEAEAKEAEQMRLEQEVVEKQQRDQQQQQQQQQRA